MVPREPTEAMHDDGSWQIGAALKQLPVDDRHDEAALKCWKAMLAAHEQDTADEG